MGEKEDKAMREAIFEVSKRHKIIIHQDNGDFQCSDCFLMKDDRYNTIMQRCIRFKVEPSDGKPNYDDVVPLCRILPINCTRGRHGFLLAHYGEGADPKAYINELVALRNMTIVHG